MTKAQPTTESQSKRRKQPAADAAVSQAEKFAAAAREHGTDQNEEAFKGVLRKLAKPKGEMS